MSLSEIALSVVRLPAVGGRRRANVSCSGADSIYIQASSTASAAAAVLVIVAVTSVIVNRSSLIGQRTVSTAGRTL